MSLMTEKTDISRRDFLKFAVGGLGGLGLGKILPNIEGPKEEAKEGSIVVENASLRTTFKEVALSEFEPKFLGVEAVNCASISKEGEECLTAVEKKVVAERVVFSDLPLNLTLAVVAEDLGGDRFKLRVGGEIHEASNDMCIEATIMTSEKWKDHLYDDNRLVYVGTVGGLWYMRERRK